MWTIRKNWGSEDRLQLILFFFFFLCFWKHCIVHYLHYLCKNLFANIDISTGLQWGVDYARYCNREDPTKLPKIWFSSHLVRRLNHFRDEYGAEVWVIFHSEWPTFLTMFVQSPDILWIMSGMTIVRQQEAPVARAHICSCILFYHCIVTSFMVCLALPFLCIVGTYSPLAQARFSLTPVSTSPGQWSNMIT